jgi:hypothetical protein
MIVMVAEKTANASKKGGFLGFGGERVSNGEQAFLEQVKSLLQVWASQGRLPWREKF